MLLLYFIVLNYNFVLIYNIFLDCNIRICSYKNILDIILIVRFLTYLLKIYFLLINLLKTNSIFNKYKHCIIIFIFMKIRKN